MRKLGLLGLSAFVACLSVVSSTHAVTLTYIYQGTVLEKLDQGHLADMIYPGDTVVYTVLVDTEAPNLNTPGLARYDALSANLQIGANTFACETPWIWVIADWAENPTSSFETTIFTSIGGARASGYFELVDLQKSGVADSELPAQPYDFAPFDWKDFSLTITNPDVYGDYSRISGSFDSFHIVPEPGSLCFLSLAGLVMVAFPGIPWLKRIEPQKTRNTRKRQS